MAVATEETMLLVVTKIAMMGLLNSHNLVFKEMKAVATRRF